MLGSDTSWTILTGIWDGSATSLGIRIEAQVQQTVANWRQLLTGSVTDGRQLLRDVLEAPLTFKRDRNVYRFRGPVAVGRMVAGVVVPT
jgi:hypothetical protein